MSILKQLIRPISRLRNFRRFSGVNLLGIIEEIASIKYLEKTDEKLHNKLVEFYCLTGGESHSKLANIFNPPKDSSALDFKHLELLYIKMINDGIILGPSYISWIDIYKEFILEGYTVLPFKLNKSHSLEWINFYIENTKIMVWVMDARLIG